jgi:phosphate/sulfate permease
MGCVAGRLRREGSPSRRLSVLLGGKVSAVRWNIAANIVIAWIVTLPASAFVAAVCYGLLRRVAE